MSVKNCFIRGSVVRYVQIPRTAVDTTLLEDATRRGESLSLDLIMKEDGALTSFVRRGSRWEKVMTRGKGENMDGMYYSAFSFCIL